MRFFINIILISGISYFLGNLGLWEWDFAIVAFVIGFFVNSNGWSSFLSGFVSISGLWYVLAMIINRANDGVLADKVAELLTLSNSGSLLLVTILVGGLVGGFATLTGSLARLTFDPPLKDLRKGKEVRKW
ncbi:MAG: hypothetical protein ACPG19_10710 [Saprospiraceae bacterium]